MSHEKLSAAIRVTIDDIDEEFVSAEALLKLAAVKELDFIETAAAASILQSFYTGIENLVLYLCKSLDGALPQTQSWHRDLLDYASKDTEKRPAIFDASTRNILVTYLDYRHVVRHGYARKLRADRTRELLLDAPKAWESARENLNHFIESLQSYNSGRSGK